MGSGAAVASGHNEPAYLQYVNLNRKWYNNRRLMALNGWIFLLSVSLIIFCALITLTPTILQPHHVLDERLRWLGYELVRVAQSLERLLQQPPWRQARSTKRHPGAIGFSHSGATRFDH